METGLVLGNITGIISSIVVLESPCNYSIPQKDFNMILINPKA